MIGLFLVTHGTLGESLVQGLCHVLHERPPQVAQLGLAAGDDPETLLPLARQMLGWVDSGRGVLLLTDLYGATPSNLAMLTGLLAVPAATAVFLAGGDAGWPALIATGCATLSGGALWMRWLLARYLRRSHPFLQS